MTTYDPAGGLEACKRIDIKDPLLRACLHGGYVGAGLKLNGVLHGGHLREGRGSEARQLLSYILRSALGVVRLPGTLDIPFDRAVFDHFSRNDLHGAIKDAKRIYEHTQAQLLGVNKAKRDARITLRRGLRPPEGPVADAIKQSLCPDGTGEWPYYFNSLTFFNADKVEFVGSHKLVIDVPVTWIWACCYTVSDLDYGDRTDEEFLVVCRSSRGALKVPASTLQRQVEPGGGSGQLHDWTPLDPMTVSGNRKDRRLALAQALSQLTQSGLDPETGGDSWFRPVCQYRPGGWESRLSAIGRRLDSWRGDASRKRASARVGKKPREDR
ncbi:MAG: hypothetical protein RJQ08_11725 [Salinisphaeraceae bacterium]